MDVKCPNCGREISPVHDQKFCSFCGGILETSDSPVEPPVSASSQGEEHYKPASGQELPARAEAYCPWEDYESLGFLYGLRLTLKQSLFAPREFFAKLPRSGGFLLPLLYAMIMETVGSYGGYLWGFAVGNPFFAHVQPSGSMAIVMGALVPLLVFFSLVAGALVLHVCILMVGAAKEDFEATFRIACYTSGPSLVNVIPVIGAWIALAWRIYLTVVAVREVHDTSTAKAVLAVLLPVIACCGLLLGGAAILAMSLGMSSGS